MRVNATLELATSTGTRRVPVTLTTEHPSSSYGLPVVVMNGEAYAPGELWGHLTLDDYDEHTADRGRRAGYDVRPKHVRKMEGGGD